MYCSCRVNGQPFKDAGYELHAAFGPVTAAECDLITGDLEHVTVDTRSSMHVRTLQADSMGRVFDVGVQLTAFLTGEGLAVWCQFVQACLQTCMKRCVLIEHLHMVTCSYGMSICAQVIL